MNGLAQVCQNKTNKGYFWATCFFRSTVAFSCSMEGEGTDTNVCCAFVCGVCVCVCVCACVRVKSIVVCLLGANTGASALWLSASCPPLKSYYCFLCLSLISFTQQTHTCSLMDTCMSACTIPYTCYTKNVQATSFKTPLLLLVCLILYAQS